MLWLASAFNPIEKYANVKLDHFARDWGENKRCLKPPPRSDLVEILKGFCVKKRAYNTGDLPSMLLGTYK